MSPISYVVDFRVYDTHDIYLLKKIKNILMCCLSWSFSNEAGF